MAFLFWPSEEAEWRHDEGATEGAAVTLSFGNCGKYEFGFIKIVRP